MEIKVLGSGCANCQRLAKNTEEAARELGITNHVEKVTDIVEIMSYQIMATPALVVNGKVMFSGRVPNKEEIKKYLQQGGCGPSCNCDAGRETSCGCDGGCCCK